MHAPQPAVRLPPVTPPKRRLSKTTPVGSRTPVPPTPSPRSPTPPRRSNRPANKSDLARPVFVVSDADSEPESDYVFIEPGPLASQPPPQPKSAQRSTSPTNNYVLELPSEDFESNQSPVPLHGRSSSTATKRHSRRRRPTVTSPKLAFDDSDDDDEVIEVPISPSRLKSSPTDSETRGVPSLDASETPSDDLMLKGSPPGQTSPHANQSLFQLVRGRDDSAHISQLPSSPIPAFAKHMAPHLPRTSDQRSNVEHRFPSKPEGNINICGPLSTSHSSTPDVKSKKPQDDSDEGISSCDDKSLPTLQDRHPSIGLSKPCNDASFSDVDLPSVPRKKLFQPKPSSPKCREYSEPLENDKFYNEDAVHSKPEPPVQDPISKQGSQVARRRVPFTKLQSENDNAMKRASLLCSSILKKSSSKCLASMLASDAACISNPRFTCESPQRQKLNAQISKKCEEKLERSSVETSVQKAEAVELIEPQAVLLSLKIRKPHSPKEKKAKMSEQGNQKKGEETPRALSNRSKRVSVFEEKPPKMKTRRSAETPQRVLRGNSTPECLLQGISLVRTRTRPNQEKSTRVSTRGKSQSSGDGLKCSRSPTRSSERFKSASPINRGMGSVMPKGRSNSVSLKSIGSNRTPPRRSNALMGGSTNNKEKSRKVSVEADERRQPCSSETRWTHTADVVIVPRKPKSGGSPSKTNRARTRAVSAVRAEKGSSSCDQVIDLDQIGIVNNVKGTVDASTVDMLENVRNTKGTENMKGRSRIHQRRHGLRSSGKRDFDVNDEHLDGLDARAVRSPLGLGIWKEVEGKRIGKRKSTVSKTATIDNSQRGRKRGRTSEKFVECKDDGEVEIVSVSPARAVENKRVIPRRKRRKRNAEVSRNSKCGKEQGDNLQCSPQGSADKSVDILACLPRNGKNGTEGRNCGSSEDNGDWSEKIVRNGRRNNYESENGCVLIPGGEPRELAMSLLKGRNGEGVAAEEYQASQDENISERTKGKKSMDFDDDIHMEDVQALSESIEKAMHGCRGAASDVVITVNF